MIYEADVIGVSAFIELLESSSQACDWCDAYATCPASVSCAALSIQTFQHFALAWK